MIPYKHCRLAILFDKLKEEEKYYRDLIIDNMKGKLKVKSSFKEVRLDKVISDEVENLFEIIRRDKVSKVSQIMKSEKIKELLQEMGDKYFSLLTGVLDKSNENNNVDSVRLLLMI
jgi:hypothetical protein